MRRDPGPAIDLGDVTVGGVGPRIAEIGGKDVDIICASGHDVEIGLSWDFVPGCAVIDLDCSVLCFTAGGALLDAAYYNQLVCMAGAIVHSGDEKTGEKEGFDESIKIDLDVVSKSPVQILMFVVNAHRGGTLTSVASAKGVVIECATGTAIAETPVSCRKGDAQGVVVGILHTEPGKPWKLRNVGRMVQGANFQESLPDIKDCLNAAGLLDSAQAMVMAMDKTFDMVKGQFLEIPPEIFRSGADLFVGLGWEANNPRGILDLDASIILVDAGGQKVDIVNYSNLSFLQGTIKHHGDNQTGEGKGDDEKIDIDLDQIPPVVQTLYIVVNVYNPWGSFNDVCDAYVRLVASKNNHEFCRFRLHGYIAAPCLVFGKLFRSPLKGTWLFDTLGVGCAGRVASENVVLQGCLASDAGVNFGPQVMNITPTEIFMPLQGITTPVSPYPLVAASPYPPSQPTANSNPPQAVKKDSCCCTLM